MIEYALKEAEKSELEYVHGFVSVSNKAARKLTKETGWIEIGEIPLSKKGENTHRRIFLIRPV